VTPELEIIFDTVKNSRKFQNLMSNSGCSFVVGWTGEITLQYEGQAHQPEGAALAHHLLSATAGPTVNESIAHLSVAFWPFSPHDDGLLRNR
jgi:hypothetical protein